MINKVISINIKNKIIKSSFFYSLILILFLVISCSEGYNLNNPFSSDAVFGSDNEIEDSNSTIKSNNLALLAHWTFDEVNSSWPNIIDSSINNYDGVINGCQINDTGSNYAIEFLGSGSYITIPDGMDILNNKSEWSLVLWVFPESGLKNIIGSSDASPDVNLFLDGIFRIYFSEYFTGTSVKYTTGVLTLNAWNFLAITRNETTIKVYINNNAPETITALSIRNGYASSDLQIGRNDSGGVMDFDGVMNDVRIYDSVLNDSQINYIRLQH